MCLLTNIFKPIGRVLGFISLRRAIEEEAIEMLLSSACTAPYRYCYYAVKGWLLLLHTDRGGGAISATLLIVEFVVLRNRRLVT